MKTKKYFIYFMASNSKVIYIGFTNNIERRIYEHASELKDGFSKKYKCKNLVYFEEYGDVKEAIAREKQLKKWSRIKKIKLIEKLNPGWLDLSKRF